MKTFKSLLEDFSACKTYIELAEDKTIEQIVSSCHRGDWLLWLSVKIGLPLNKVTLAKARCAKTVIGLMKDKRSINAVNIAERFGLDECSLYELASAADAADAYAAKLKNQKQTADICREIVGELIINKVN